MKENQTGHVDLLLEMASGIPLGPWAYVFGLQDLISALALVMRG